MMNLLVFSCILDFEFFSFNNVSISIRNVKLNKREEIKKNLFFQVLNFIQVNWDFWWLYHKYISSYNEVCLLNSQCFGKYDWVA